MCVNRGFVLAYCIAEIEVYSQVNIVFFSHLTGKNIPVENCKINKLYRIPRILKSLHGHRV